MSTSLEKASKTSTQDENTRKEKKRKSTEDMMEHDSGQGVKEEKPPHLGSNLECYEFLRRTEQQLAEYLLQVCYFKLEMKRISGNYSVSGLSGLNLLSDRIPNNTKSMTII